MRSWGCLVILIPITICATVPMVFVVWMFSDSIIRDGWQEMGPTGKSLTFGFLAAGIVPIVPTLFLWWIYLSAPKPPSPDPEIN